MKNQVLIDEQKERRRATKKRWKDKTRHIRNKYVHYGEIGDQSKAEKVCIICESSYIGHACSNTCSKECKRVHSNNRKRALAPPKVEVFKDCEWCGNSFKLYRSRGKFCSRKCRQALANSQAPRKLNGKQYITKDCEWCNSSFESYLGYAKYCSETCISEMNKIRCSKLQEQWRIDNPIQSKDCKNCGKTFMPNTRSSIIKYCSNKCLRQHWVDSSPMVRLSARFSLGIRGVISGKNKKSNVWEYLSFTPDELMSQFESQFTDGMSWDNMSEWHIDHIRPVSSFDFDSTDHPDFKKCWALNNLQPLWAKDNMSKGAKWDGVVNA